MNKILLLTPVQIILLYFGFSMVYLLGLFIPLMENDSAQHASMAMKMVLDNDFLNIYKGDNPYLDKPHMHFWLAALSMKLFGINQIAYRIPALLFLLLAAFSTKKLSDLLYENTGLGHISSLIFLSAQTIILSAHDVRTDAVLTGFIIFSLWQWVKFIKTQHPSSVILAGVGTAFAFSSKGLMAVVIIGFCIFAYLIYSREWKKFLNSKLIVALLGFFIGIIPVLYAYNHQFGEEGIKFILFNQSLNRLTASGFEETSPDYLFFFHTLLWVFLPFSLAFYFGVFEKTAFFIKNKFRKITGTEFLTLGGFWLVMLIFSVSKFKLPHYLNGLIPILSIFTSAYLFELYRNSDRKIKILYIIQLVVIFASLLGIILLTFYFTGIQNVTFLILFALLFACLIRFIFKSENKTKKIIFISLLFSVTINIYLNSQFYPVLARYQGSLRVAEFVNKNRIDKNKICMLTNAECWAFDFYTQRNTPRVAENMLKKEDYLVIYDEELKKFTKKYTIIDQENNYRITKLSLKFINPSTRKEQYNKIYLIKIL